MKIDMEKTKALMEQVELWLKSSESEIRMDLTLCKTGTPDTFKVRYDANRIGLLVLMLGHAEVFRRHGRSGKGGIAPGVRHALPGDPQAHGGGTVQRREK